MIDLNQIDPAPIRYDLEEIARRLRASAERWVPALFPKGRRQGDEWRLANIQGAPPRKSGSCVIMLRGDHAGDWHDFDGGQGGGPLATLAQGTGLADRALFAHAAGITGWQGDGPARQETPAAPKPERDASLDIAFIRDNAAPIQGTAAQRYLEGRGLIIPPDADLLFHPDLTHYETRTGYPAMIGLIRNIAGEVVALHRTYLEEAQDKVSKAAIAKPRMMIGKTAGGTVRLGAITAQGLLGLCEGIETGLAVMRACPTLPVWAALSTSGMEQAQLPPEARRIVILADHDPSGAGLRAAEATAAKLQLEGREVRIAMPTTPGTDFNDMLLREGGPAILKLIEDAISGQDSANAQATPQAAETGRHLPIGFVEPSHSLPSLSSIDGNLRHSTRRAWSLLIASNRSPWIFRLGGQPTWVVPDDEGRPAAATIDIERMRHMLANLADWRKPLGKGESIPTPPPSNVIKSLLATPDPALPVLAGIVTAPVFGRNGSLLTEPGYHPDARLLYHPPPGFSLPPIPAKPSAEEIAAARSLLLDELLGDFPFTGEAERAHALCLLLLGFVRPMIEGPTPLHMIEKPTPGTGATLMVDAIATVLTGSSASVMTEGRDDDEWRKRLTAKLRQLPVLLLIDNLRQELDSAALAAALTAPAWEDRILGVSDIIRLPVRCTWVATGNNPAVSHEIARRLVRIRLDARSDQPWRREGFRHPDLMIWVRANRARLVAACLTLCQAWTSAGRPPAARSLGSFETWSETLGGILHVAGVPGFLGNLDEVMEASDSEGGSWRAFIQLWWDRFGSAEVSVSDLIGFARHAEASLPISAKNEHGLKVALGAAFTKLRDRAFRTSDRLVHLRQGKLLHNSQRWRLAPAEEAPNHGGLGGLMGVSDEKTPIAGSQEIRGFDGSWGSWGSCSIPYTRAHTRMNKREVEKDPQDPQDPQSAENSVSYGWGSSKERPPQTPIDPPWLEGVP
ncbi:MAG: toprim domain-containing protein [Roseomonas sp.]|nr:toprim domain-containing protein [Roseomonas sp.]